MRVLFLFLFLAAGIIYAAPDTVIARVGDKIITSGELRTRFEFSPQVYGQISPENKKKLFLYTLIAEKLFALEAEKNNAGSSDLIRYTYNEIERMYMRDALYKLEITDKVVVSEEELRNAAAREMYKLVVTPYYTPDSSEARKIYKYLLSGTALDSVEFFSAQDIEAGYGDLRPDIENAVYNLKVDEFTVPIFYGRGWYIFKLKEKKIADPSSDVTSVIKKAERKLKEMKSAYIYEQYFNNFFYGRSVEADGNIFWSIVNKLTSRLKSKDAGKDGYKLSSDDVKIIEQQFGDSLSSVYISIDKTPLDIKSFLRKLNFQGFTVDNPEEGVIAGKLNAAVKMIIENELLTAEAYKRNLDQLPEVQESLRMWKDNNLSVYYTMQIADSLKGLQTSSAEGSDLLTVVELYTENLSVVEGILNELDNGKEFESLVKEFNKSTGAPESRGFFESAPASMLGEIGRVAVNLKEGDVYGPVSIQGGYSIIKLIKKQKTSGISGDKEKSAAYSEFSSNLEAVKNAAVKLAGRYGVDINYEALEKLSVGDYNMFTIRMMGFGGRIPAVPVVSPFYEWFELWQNSTKEVP